MRKIIIASLRDTLIGSILMVGLLWAFSDTLVSMIEKSANAYPVVKTYPNQIVLPRDLKHMSIKKKKATFVEIIRPLIMEQNNKILDERDLVLLNKDLPRLYKKYKTRNRKELLKRVRPIPMSLALAQAAHESGWGTSHFAQRGNAIFGQHATKGEARIRGRRDRGVGVKAYSNISDSIEDYMLNLNTHRAYAALRDRRDRGRADGIDLAQHLVLYSERRHRYVEDIVKMISYNRF